MLEFGTQFAQVTLTLSILIAVYRLVKGPTLPDRVVAMDLIGILVIGLIAVLPPPRRCGLRSTRRSSLR